MKILHISPHPFEEGMGGVSEYVRNITKKLAVNNDVTVFATDPEGNLPRCEIIDGVSIERYKRWAPGRAYYFSYELLKKIRKDEYDIVHSHSYVTFPFQTSFMAKSKKLIYTTHMHELPTSNFRKILLYFYNPIGKRILKKASKIIAVSSYEKNLLIKNFGMEEKNISVIPCGLNMDEFNLNKKNMIKQASKNILYVGRLDDYKGVKYLVEVMPYLDNEVVLTIVGRGPLSDYLRKRTEQLKISNRVIFHDYVTRVNLLEMFSRSDLFILLSRFEAYSITVAEALASGTPCLLSNTAALSEWIDGENCIGIDYPIDVAELADKIVKILTKSKDVKIDHLLGNKILDWQQVANAVEKIYLTEL